MTFWKLPVFCASPFAGFILWQSLTYNILGCHMISYNMTWYSIFLWRPRSHCWTSRVFRVTWGARKPAPHIAHCQSPSLRVITHSTPLVCRSHNLHTFQALACPKRTFTRDTSRDPWNPWESRDLHFDRSQRRCGWKGVVEKVWFIIDSQLGSNWFPIAFQLLPIGFQLVPNCFPIGFQLLSNWFQMALEAREAGRLPSGLERERQLRNLDANDATWTRTTATRLGRERELRKPRARTSTSTRRPSTIYIYIYTYVLYTCIYIYIYIYIYIHVCICVYMCVCIYIYIYIYILRRGPTLHEVAPGPRW